VPKLFWVDQRKRAPSTMKMAHAHLRPHSHL
jgi:hypothetical protein